MKIGFLTTEFVTEANFAGGLSNYIYRVSRLLVERGHEVHVFTYAFQAKELIHEGIFVHHISNSSWPRRINKALRNKFPLTIKWLDFSFQAYKCIKEIHSQVHLDLLQYPSVHGCGLFSILFLDIPFCVRISSYTPLWNKLQNREDITDHKILENIGKLQLKLAKHIFAPSYRLKYILESELNLPEVSVISTPFFVETLNTDDKLYQEKLGGEKYILFFAGRLASHKGPQVLAKALPRIFAEFPNIKSVFIGRDAEYKNQSMREFILSELYDFKHRILFLDSLSHHHLYPIIQHAEVVALPSLIDNIPNACLEALGLGAVVIGTKDASFDEIIEDKVDGFLVSSGNSKELERTLMNILSSSGNGQIRVAAKSCVQKFSPEATIPKLENYYSQLVATNN
ncbi:MAG: glycosyltransferase family 4 protein [Cyanothece sp. SIO1E1]|nr:glycosyltransferase family 4 protein [Cyanothece sp. SIO1E1]